MFSSTTTNNWEIEELDTPQNRNDFKRIAKEMIKNRQDLMDSDDWVIVKDASDFDEVLIETKDIQDSNIIMTKATGFCKLQKGEDLRSLAMDIFDPTLKLKRNALHENISEYEKIKSVRDNIEVVRMEAYCPGVTNRDFLVLRTYEKIGDTYLIAVESINHPDHPFDPNCVRGVARSGVWVSMLTDEVAQIISIDHVDPRGWIPSMLINTLVTASGSWIEKL